jgi:hypothetical protein
VSQEQLVLQHLKSGKSLTPIEALNRYGIFRLSARIHRLRDAGHIIRTENITNPTGTKTYAAYRLEKSP